MTHLAVGYRTIEAPGQGRELKTDGYHNHIGGMDIGSLRVRSRAGHPSLTGAGVETIFIPPTGVFQCYDRDAQQYLDLNIAGRNISLSPQSGGTLTLPPNCVGTNQIQGNAVQQQVASYQSGNGWQSSGNNVWQETSIQVSGAFSGANVARIEYALSFSNNTAGALNQIALGLDGGMSWPVVAVHQTVANYICFAGGTFYTGGLSGTHRVSLFVAVNLGVLTFVGSFYQCLIVTEQKR